MTNVDTPSTLTHVSLCAGYGGIDLGLKRAIPSLRTIAFAEIEAFACANLVAKMEAGLLDPAPLWTNLKTFPWSDFHDCVDILSGGYPCQPFSAAGKRLGADDPRHLWPYISAGIAAMRPSLCFFENVEGHITLGLPDVIEDLAGLGYRTTWGIFSASEVGAVHQRKRVFILAECSSQRSAARFSRSLAGQEGIAGITNNGSGKTCNELEHAQLHRRQDWQHDNAGPQLGGGHSAPWPSRPGQQQYEWEPPRVVVDAKSQRVGQRSELCGEECGQGTALPRDAEQPSQERDVADAQCSERRESESAGDVTNRHNARWQQTASGLGKSSEAMGDTPSQRRSSNEDNESRRIAQAGGSNGSQSNGQIESPLGGDPHGPAGGVGYAELCVTSDNRTDELRLLGNGVVPATAERAFRVLFAELT